MQSVESIKTDAYGMTTDLVCKKKEIKCINIIKQKMFKFLTIHTEY